MIVSIRTNTTTKIVLVLADNWSLVPTSESDTLCDKNILF
jgi:hypothetical protein